MKNEIDHLMGATNVDKKNINITELTHYHDYRNISNYLHLEQLLIINNLKVYREGVTFFGKFYLDHFYSQLASALNRPKRMWASYWAAALQHRATRTFSTPENSFSPRKTSVNVYRNFFSVILLKFALKKIIRVVFTNFFYLHEG
jgi:hypothetical protein